MIQVTVKTAKHTHVFQRFPIDWDSVSKGVEEIDVFLTTPNTSDQIIHIGGEGRKFAFNKGVNNLSTGLTTTTLVVGVIEGESVTAFELYDNGFFTDVSEQVAPMILSVQNQPNNRLIK